MGAHDTQACCMQINNTMKQQKNKGMPSEKKPYCNYCQHSL